MKIWLYEQIHCHLVLCGGATSSGEFMLRRKDYQQKLKHLKPF